MIRDAHADDAAVLCRIYNRYVRDTVITFEEEAVTLPTMAHRLAAVTAAWPWLVCEVDGAVAGFAYADRWKARSAYRHTVESTIYFDQACTGRGFGRVLYSALLDRLRRLDVHAVVAAIALPNPASVALHERCGYTAVGRFAQVGRKFGRWVDVGYWQVVIVEDDPAGSA